MIGYLKWAFTEACRVAQAVFESPEERFIRKQQAWFEYQARKR